jgi:hypothetical protein
MEQSRSRGSAGCTVRRAELIDVPAVARLLGAPIPLEWPGAAAFFDQISDQTLTSATRLALTHVALDLGEFWVAVDSDDQVRASVVLLPPGREGDQIMDMALRLELGLMPNTLPELMALADPATLADVPEQHWLLLLAAAPRDEPILRELIDRALPAIDADGRPVLSLQGGTAQRVLSDVGFRALASQGLAGSAALRPGARRPVGV